ncbi:MAG: hypothetical protein WD768_13215 [Phycisphaeraceae bacterium]
MDEYLASRITPAGNLDEDAATTALIEGQTQIRSDGSGTIEILHHDINQPPERYQLKPLAELYGQGYGATVDPLDPDYMPLFLAIEKVFADMDGSSDCRDDGDVCIALDLLALDPAGDVSHNAVAHHVQVALRLALSLADYSRDEVRQALRKIKKSVDRHNRQGGQRGYLDFIRDYV